MHNFAVHLPATASCAIMLSQNQGFLGHYKVRDYLIYYYYYYYYYFKFFAALAPLSKMS
jgi:hypothetical protein